MGSWIMESCLMPSSKRPHSALCTVFFRSGSGPWCLGGTAMDVADGEWPSFIIHHMAYGIWPWRRTQTQDTAKTQAPARARPRQKKTKKQGVDSAMRAQRPAPGERPSLMGRTGRCWDGYPALSRLERPGPACGAAVQAVARVPLAFVWVLDWSTPYLCASNPTSCTSSTELSWCSAAVD